MFSLVAEVEEKVVGHVISSQVTLMPTIPGLKMLGLGPVAVLPEMQRQGIGSRLIQEALQKGRAEGWHAMVVVGQPEFYTRFGFLPANRFELRCEFRVPNDNFLVVELKAGTLPELSGMVRYQPEFSGF